MDVLTRVLSQDELTLLLQSASDYYKHCIIISLGTGLRISDLVLLEKKNSIPKFDIVERKTGKVRHIVLPTWCLNSWLFLVQYQPSCPFLFSVRDKSSYRKYLKQLADKVGIDPNGVAWHSLRKSSAFQIAKQFGISQAQLFLNHSSIRTTMPYVNGSNNILEFCFDGLRGVI